MTVDPKFPIPPKLPTPRPGTAVSWDRSVGTSDVDLLDEIARFRVAFMRAGLEPPDVVVFEDRMRAIGFLHHVSQREVMVHSLRPEMEPVRTGDDYWHEAEVVGMRFRWPARPIKLQGGGTGWA